MGQPAMTAVTSDSSGQRMVYGAEGAGIWQSENGGASWLPVSTRFLAGGRLEGAKLEAVDSDADTMLAKIYKSIPTGGGFYRNLYTVDGGQTWAPFTHDSVRTTGQVYASPHFHQVWFHIHNGTLRRSTDNGQTWPLSSRIPVLEDDHAFLEHFYQDPLHDSTLFYTGNYSYNPDDSVTIGGLLRSDDLGLNWRPVFDFYGLYDMTNAAVQGVLRLSNGNLLMISWSLPATVLQSSDDGLTWSPLTGLPDNQYVERIIQDPLHPAIWYLIGSGTGGLLRTTNSGATWQDSLPGLPNQWTTAHPFYQNPYSGRIILMTGDNRNLYTLDQGDSWQALPLPSIGAGCDFSYTPQSLFARTAAGDGWGGHYAYAPQSNSWQALTMPLTDENHFRQISKIFYRNADTLAAFMVQTGPVRDSTVSGVLRSENNGASWTLQAPLRAELNAEYLSFGSVDTVTHLVVATALQDSIISSSDLGQTWAEPVALQESEFVKEMVQSRQALYVLTADYMGYGASIFRSTNFGRSMDEITPTGRGFYNMVMLGDDLIVALGERALLHRRNEWDIRSAMPFAHLTTNWKMVAIPDSLHRLVAMINDSSMLWMSDNLGNSWSSRYLQMPLADQTVHITNLTCDTTHQRLWVSTGAGACYLNFDELVFSDAPLVLKPAAFDLLTVYPNPFNNESRISYSVERPGLLRLELYNLTGQRVRTLVDRVSDAGQYETRLDAEGLASGTYFVRLATATTQRTEKILVLK
jgi:photosystem II stability/assembly factor-like uncharacterized protein